MITEKQIHLHSSASTQEGVFQAIADLAVENGIAVDNASVVAGLKERESLSTTGFQDGFAIPHTQSDSITRPAIIIVRTETGIEWESFDGKPAFFFISLLVPHGEAGTTHLQALAALSRALMDDESRQAFLTAQSSKQLAHLIKNAIQGDE
ncbi:PTS sugar transporter subunit IIA [Shouchella clausii]|uniref:PTS sugar transporter subunit IIA n=1 Tax=Shouchella clausii TaxID=79880 RepID=UPI000B95CC2A|nr:PTS sugar transporter subunit IIA [Shouchella clausii]AST96602.1 PTS fructose transporter subunit IIBC [Shouchella clausii]MEB5471202.1 PTS sugar transporter subunit IIA [Shouchella clausii]PAF15153.1 PTS fructose transporter subunit IIBC [Shouchella clausii]QNM42958.1 PTS sugar transporter subunit IIA [Shouchella clausii]WQG94181.1 PTS sugar transporter subunit IIA [Shouchella clausii]